MKYLSKLSRRMASMLCTIYLLASLGGCNLAEPQPISDGLDPEPPSGTPPTVTTPTCDNRPADYTVAFDTPWNQLPALQPAISSEGFQYFAGQANTLSTIQANDAPLSPPNVLRIGFPAVPQAGPRLRAGARAHSRRTPETFTSARGYESVRITRTTGTSGRSSSS